MKRNDTVGYDLNINKIINVYERKHTEWERNIRKSRHFDAIVFFTEGEIEYSFVDKSIVAQKGDVLFLPRNLPYCGKSKSNINSYYVIDFECYDAAQFENFGAPCSFPAYDYQQTQRLFEEAVSLWSKQSSEASVGIKAYLYSLLKEWLLYSDEQRKSPKDQILSYIESEFEDPDLTVKKICKALYISDSQLRRRIQKLTGKSPNEYINFLRLNKAKILLASSRKSIKAIACECGFASSYYFSRIFNEKVGMSPSVYRSLVRDSI